MAVDKRLVLLFAFTNILLVAAGAVTIVISLMWRMDALNGSSMGGPFRRKRLIRSRWIGRTKYHFHDDSKYERTCRRHYHCHCRSNGDSTYISTALTL